MVSYLKEIATRKDSPCVEAWIKDGKVTGEQTKKQKKHLIELCLNMQINLKNLKNCKKN